MFGKSSKWWFGKNSIFGQAIRQTKYGAQGASYDPSFNGTSEADMLKYGILFGMFYLLAKK
jgi:hypothetical protein